jgi:hypothetical protein
MDHIEVPMPATNEPERLIDTKAAAARIGLAPITLRLWRWRRVAHQPAYTRIGRNIRYSPAVLDAFIAARTTKPRRKSTVKKRSQT